MEQSQPQPGPSGLSPQALAGVVPADELGFARYVHRPQPAGQRARRDVVRFRCARNHYARLLWFLDMAWRKLEEYRQEIREIVERVKEELSTHADTTVRLRKLDNLLRSKTEEYSKIIYRLASNVKDAQKEICCLLESRETTDGDYERTEQVLVALPTHSVSHKLALNFRRVTAWITRGGLRRKPSSDDTESLLQSDLLNMSDGDVNPTAKSGRKQSVLDAAGGYNSCQEVVPDVGGDKKTAENAEGLKNNSETPGDVEKRRVSPECSVLQQLWQQHRDVKKTLLALVKTLRERQKARARTPRAAAVGRGAALREEVALKAVASAVEDDLRAARLRLARHKQEVELLGADAWPGQPAARPRRSVTPPLPFWSLCGLLGCLRRC